MTPPTYDNGDYCMKMTKTTLDTSIFTCIRSEPYAIALKSIIVYLERQTSWLKEMYRAQLSVKSCDRITIEGD